MLLAAEASLSLPPSPLLWAFLHLPFCRCNISMPIGSIFPQLSVNCFLHYFTTMLVFLFISAFHLKPLPHRLCLCIDEESGTRCSSVAALLPVSLGWANTSATPQCFSDMRLALTDADLCIVVSMKLLLMRAAMQDPSSNQLPIISASMLLSYKSLQLLFHSLPFFFINLARVWQPVQSLG